MVKELRVGWRTRSASTMARILGKHDEKIAKVGKHDEWIARVRKHDERIAGLSELGSGLEYLVQEQLREFNTADR